MLTTVTPLINGRVWILPPCLVFMGLHYRSKRGEVHLPQAGLTIQVGGQDRSQQSAKVVVGLAEKRPTKRMRVVMGGTLRYTEMGGGALRWWELCPQQILGVKTNTVSPRKG